MYLSRELGFGRAMHLARAKPRLFTQVHGIRHIAGLNPLLHRSQTPRQLSRLVALLMNYNETEAGDHVALTPHASHAR